MELKQHFSDFAKIFVGALLGGVVSVYFVQEKANRFTRKTDALNRDYAQRQETLASLIPVLEKSKHALDSLPDHDTLVGMPLEMIRQEVVKAAEREGKTLDDLEANSALFEIKLETAFGKQLADEVGAIEIRLHGFVDHNQYFRFPRQIHTKEQFLADDAAYDALLKITQETEELSDSISDVERKLLTYKETP